MADGGVLIRGARCIDPANGLDQVADLWVHSEGIVVNPNSVEGSPTVIDGTGLWAMPGLVDLQVHFREPGFEYKETIESGSAAALAGGITTVVVMPNTHPALDTPESVRFESEESERVNGIRILVAAAATVGIEGTTLTDHGALKGAGAVAITDDGMPVMDDDVMAGSLRLCKTHDLLFMQHAENLDMTGHAPMTLSPVSEEIGVRGQPAAAEGDMVERDVALVEKIGARYHVLHTTTARSLDAIRAAKKMGLPVTCEVSPHHLLLNYEACATADPNTKMNPPLRSEADRQALILAMVDGTADAVATDHAPHSAAEKALGFVQAPFGVIGLETAFAAVMTFVHDGTLSANRAVELMTSGPARVLKMTDEVGSFSANAADVTLVDPDQSWIVDAADFKGRSKNSAFIGRRFTGRVVATVMRGALRYSALTTALLLFVMGCDTGWTEGPGDARLTADAWAWPCDYNEETWVGTKHFFVDLQHAPELIETRPLPEVGQCAVWGSTFAKDDLIGGSAVPEVQGLMEWSLLNGGAEDRVSEGTFQPLATGYWHSDAYDEHHTCYPIETVMLDGVEVRNAPSLVGVSTPKPGTIDGLSLDTSVLNGVPFGTEFSAAWTTTGWQEAFILLNRSRSGFTVESVLCNVTGQDSFTADAAFWDLSNQNTGSDSIRFFIGFRNLDKQVSATGLKVETVARGLWSVAVVN